MHYSFSYIARELRRSPSTIAREVLKRRTFASHFRAGSNDCIEYFNCLHKHLCPTETKYTCFQNCKFCTEYNCTTICEFYISEHCPRLEKPPYVCTSCKEKKGCRKVQAYYSAFKANHLYLETLRESRMGHMPALRSLNESMILLPRYFRTANRSTISSLLTPLTYALQSELSIIT
mgnify:CR=1 FL=1